MRNDYCITKADHNCDSCPFSFHKNGLDKSCHYLTAFEIADIFNKIEEEKKEDKTMNITELEQEIAKTKKQLERLEKALNEAKNKVPEELEFIPGENCWFINSDVEVCAGIYTRGTWYHENRVTRHQLFKSKEFVDLFDEKSQFIADLLHFKWLYDRDYVPDWSSEHEAKYEVYFNSEFNKYVIGHVWHYNNIETIYFSTTEIAQKCADWLNSRRKEE